MALKRFILLSALVFAACSDNVASGASEDVGITPLGKWQVAGLSQKGPFVTGSTVNVFELEGSTLNQTGKIFKSTIRSDKGDFVVSGPGLASQYAIIEVEGYYRNEMTGQKSSGTLVLNAITDLSHRENVVVNLLTHLEYERVKYLVVNGKSVKDAKAQAEKEILTTMAMDESGTSFEDLNIFKEGEENAKLLAISILMHSDVDVAGLTERIGKFSLALENNGVWNDSLTRTSIADWASDASEEGTLKNIRDSILAWDVSKTLPNFEKYIDMFWADNYGLGKCSKSNEGDTSVNVNILSSRYGDKFICMNEHWEYAHTRISKYKGEFGILNDERDGRSYKTVQVGDQTWMAENLRYNYSAKELVTGCPENIPDNCEKMGRLYSYAAAMDSAGLFSKDGLECVLNESQEMDCDYKESLRGVCPEGWHLPSQKEWESLISVAGGYIMAKKTLRTADDFGTDELGFNITDETSRFWTSSKFEYSGSLTGFPACLNFAAASWISFEPSNENEYVRCVKDRV